ncbi:MAG: HEPN domain-containing protein [Chloroflexi bacterium]|nr:HEPN domain-containing protein [Chloroflexota bacterium]
MLAHDETTHVIQQWVQKAENDLKNATHTLKLGAECPTDTVCFHAQQCVEKYLKSMLVFEGTDISRTHHISALMELLPANIRPDLSPEEQEMLTDYAVSTRYPGDYEPIPLGDARRAVQIARRIRKHARSLLPPASLKRE